MGRKKREISNSGFYHVMTRGNHKETIFHSDADRNKYLSILENFSSDQFQIHCYCLMPNHVHLLVFSENLSTFMKNISQSYATWFNWKYKLIGHLFQGRFLSEIIESDQYYLNCLRYIIRNPIKAQIHDTFDYQWNSFKNYYSKEPGMIITDKMEKYFLDFDDFFNFLSLGNEDKFMDMENLYIPADEEIKDFFIKERIKSLVSLDNIQKQQVLKKIRDQYPRVSISQIARVCDEKNRSLLSALINN